MDGARITKRRAIPFQLGIDVSGQPPNTVVVGLISFHPFTKDAIIHDFYKTFPALEHKKGRHLRAGELSPIVEFLDGKEVRMVAKTFTTNDWQYIYSSYPNKAYVKEKIMGILYFSALRRVARKGMVHPVTMCVESHIDISKAQEVCLKLARLNKYLFDISHGNAKSNRIIKMADFVAAAGRKIKTKKLDSYRNFTKDMDKIPPWVFRKVFK